MAELTQKERLQPSLLDRLTDDEPEKVQEPREMRVLSLTKLRQSVLRDIAWLLNTGNLEALQSLDNVPFTKHSVINYGIPDLTGATLSGVNIQDIENSIRQAIWDFEPRILKNSVKVKVTTSNSNMNHNAMTFDIEGDLWMQPLPLRLYLKTELDLNTGIMDIVDQTG